MAGASSDLGIHARYRGFTAWTDVRRADPWLQVVLDELEASSRTLREVLAARARGQSPSAGTSAD